MYDLSKILIMLLNSNNVTEWKLIIRAIKRVSITSDWMTLHQIITDTAILQTVDALQFRISTVLLTLKMIKMIIIKTETQRLWGSFKSRWNQICWIFNSLTFFLDSCKLVPKSCWHRIWNAMMQWMNYRLKC